MGLTQSVENLRRWANRPETPQQRDAATGVPDPPPAPAPDAEQPQNVAKRRRSSLESQDSANSLHVNVSGSASSRDLLDFELKHKGSLEHRRRSGSIDPKVTSPSDGALAGPLGMGRRKKVSLYTRPPVSQPILPEEEEDQDRDN